MFSRYRWTIGMAVMAPVSLTSVAIGAQGPSARASSKRPERRGVAAHSGWRQELHWIGSFAMLTPVERPLDLTGKEMLTEEEAATLEGRPARNRVGRGLRPGDPAPIPRG